MRSLRDYLNNTQQYESILDPNQDQVMSRMTDDMIRQRIREYCTYDYKKRRYGEIWPANNPILEITKVDKDDKGWYVETKTDEYLYLMPNTRAKSFYERCMVNGQKIDKQKGFLIEDIGVYFRWRKHKGALIIYDADYFESTKGLSEELDELSLSMVCKKSKKLDVCNKIKVITLWGADDINISGNGCKNVIIHPDHPCGNITVPNGVKIHRPKNDYEYQDLCDKLIH